MQFSEDIRTCHNMALDTAIRSALKNGTTEFGFWLTFVLHSMIVSEVTCSSYSRQSA